MVKNPAEQAILDVMEKLKTMDKIPNRVFYLLHEAINIIIRDHDWDDEYSSLKSDLESKKHEPDIADQRK